jgi:hypothetical protein
MLKPAVHLQHAYECLIFERNKRYSINVQAYCSGKHKSEARKLDKFFMAIKEKLLSRTLCRRRPRPCSSGVPC